MSATDVHAARSPHSAPFEFDVAALFGELRRSGFDLRRSVFVAYLIEAGTDRDAAFALWRRATDAGWEASLYGDESGWVVRLGRTGRLKPEALTLEQRSVHRLASAFGAAVRGFTIEDVRPDDCWDTLATQVQGRPPTVSRAAVPAQRRGSGSAGSPLSRTA